MDPELLEILACPADWEDGPCHGPLVEKDHHLHCQRCGGRYPIEDGIPVLLVERIERT